MNSRHRLLQRLSVANDSKIVLLILDGVGDIRTHGTNGGQPETPLQAAATPNLDRLAQKGALGRINPVATGITPGSGPGHLALFGNDPTAPECDIGRGVLEALGLDLEVAPGTVAARGNFATVADDGLLTDRRAGRISSDECQRLCEKLTAPLNEAADAAGLEASIHPGEGYRFVLLLKGKNLSADLLDTDPQQIGLPIKPLAARNQQASESVASLAPILSRLEATLSDEPQANAFLLRGFASMPELPSFEELYQLRSAALAAYPLYRGVAKACGMDTIAVAGKEPQDLMAALKEQWHRYDFFFLHVKQTDQAGEDGNFPLKVATLESVDRALPQLLELQPTVLAITGDHSTPVPMSAHSWHPVPLLIASNRVGIDRSRSFDEDACRLGLLGDLPAQDLIGLLMANAGRLLKFGA